MIYSSLIKKTMMTKETFLDQTKIDDWFYDYKIPALNDLGKQYIITDYGIKSDGRIYTKQIQNLIDHIHTSGGGVLVIPSGTYMTGVLYFKDKVHLYLSKDATLKGSNNILDYDIKKTRIEGESCMYYTALLNFENVNGTYIFGEGTVDGNGHKSWEMFWKRREWNPECTNKDEQRPRLLYISNSSNVTISGIKLINSHFWTTHLYKCDHVKYLNCYIYSPAKPVKAPSTDAIDIDACSYILIKNCYLEVNDDAVVLKGGKGPYADTDLENGSNEKIIIEDCEYGFCHGCLTCGSESIHNKNIIMRRIKVSNAANLLWLKMRPDTPQIYENIIVEDVSGNISKFLNINPWTQFFDLKGRKDIPLSYAKNIVMKNCKCDCDTFFYVKKDDSQYRLSNFSFENLHINAANIEVNKDCIKDFKLINLDLKKI